MKVIALDIGTRRTGIAFYDSGTGIPLPLDTITHTSEEDLLSRVEDIVRQRQADLLLIGLPLLPSGKEGTQAGLVRQWALGLAGNGIPVIFADERYTTPRHAQGDGNAEAACTLLQTGLESGNIVVDKGQK